MKNHTLGGIWASFSKAANIFKRNLPRIAFDGGLIAFGSMAVGVSYLSGKMFTSPLELTLALGGLFVIGVVVEAERQGIMRRPAAAASSTVDSLHL